MYVYSGIGGVVGIAAEGADAGKVLWESLKWGCSVVAPSPVCFPDGKIFLTAGYGREAWCSRFPDRMGISL